MKNALLFLLSLLASQLVQAQTFLFFPETTPTCQASFNTQTCLHESASLLLSADTNNIAKLQTFGLRLLNLGQREYGKDVFERIVQLTESSYGKKHPRYREALLNLARAQNLLIRYDLSTLLYEEVLQLIKQDQGASSPEYTHVLGELSQTYGQIREYAKATKLTETVLADLEKAQKTQTVYYAITLNNLGIIKQQINNLPEAIRNYEKAMGIFKQLRLERSFHGLATVSNLAEALARNGQNTAAQTLMKTYLGPIQALGKNKDFMSGRVLFHAGSVMGLLGEFRKAEELFKLALISNSWTFERLDDLGKQAKDLMLNNQYIAICTQAGSMMTAAFTFDLEYKKTGSLKALQTAHQLLQAMAIFESQMQASFVTERDKLILFQLGAGVGLQKGIELSYELYQKTKERQYLEQAFHYTERTKSTLLLNALRQRDQNHFGQVKPEWLAQEQALQKQIKQAQKKVLEAPNQAAQLAAKEELNSLNRQIDQLKSQIKSAYPQFYRHRYEPYIASLTEVQAAIPLGTAFVEYSLGLEKAYAFLITADQVEMIALDYQPAQAQAQADALRKSLSDYDFLQTQRKQADSLLKQSSYYFYQFSLAPVLAKLKTKGIARLSIVPDGLLAHLPFEVFLTELPSNKATYRDYPYLIKQYPISYGYSATLNLEKEKLQRNNKPQNLGVLGMAASYEGVNTNLAEQRRSGIEVLRKSLQPLPGALEEVKLMNRYLYGNFFLGKEANEATFKRLAGQYNIIHLAMHGLLDKAEPLLSNLAFTEDGQAGEDNFLYAYEISQMELNARLVVLSACETGYGKFRQGEGVMSLAHSFMYAGVPSVVVSLWQVNDAATGKIMEYFYRNLSASKDKDAALQQAKLQFLGQADELAAHPAYWAAFVQMGNTAPIELFCKVGQMINYLLGGLGAVLGLVGLWWAWRRYRA